MDLNIKNMGLKEMYARLKESGNSDDFPLLLSTEIHKIVIDSYKGIVPVWQFYALKTSIADFKTHNRILLSEAEDLLELVKNEPIKDSYLTEARYTIVGKTYERKLSLTREAIINDDTDTLVRSAQRLGRAAARTVSNGVASLLELGGATLAYDSIYFFTAANWPAGHHNLGTTALTADITGANILATHMMWLRTQKDIAQRGYLGLTPKYLVVCPTLESIARSLIGSQTIPNAGGTAFVTNPVYAGLTVVVEPYYDATTTGWFVACEPSECAGIEVGFLNGQDIPQILVKAPTAITQTGTSDPYDFNFETIEWKVRHDYGIAFGDPRGLQCGKL